MTERVSSVAVTHGTRAHGGHGCRPKVTSITFNWHVKSAACPRGVQIGLQTDVFMKHDRLNTNEMQSAVFEAVERNASQNLIYPSTPPFNPPIHPFLKPHRIVASAFNAKLYNRNIYGLEKNHICKSLCLSERFSIPKEVWFWFWNRFSCGDLELWRLIEPTQVSGFGGQRINGGRVCASILPRPNTKLSVDTWKLQENWSGWTCWGLNMFERPPNVYGRLIIRRAL